MLKCIRQHLSPSGGIVQSDIHGVLHERGNVWRLPGCYQSANFLNLLVVKRDGNLPGRHTNYHTTEPARLCVTMLRVAAR